MQADHLSICQEANRQLRKERGELAGVIAGMFERCYANSYLRGDEVALILRNRYLGVSSPQRKAE